MEASRKTDGAAGEAFLDVTRVREDFPILARTVRGKPLVYLDNANTAQKPRQVLDAETQFYEHEYSNIHRGVYLLSQEATELFDAARDKVARFLNARDSREVVFVRGTTEAMNLVASSFGGKYLRSGDEVLLSVMEHHSGIVPWQLACEATGAKLRVIPMNDAGELLVDDAERLMGPRTRIVSLIHVSNALGTVNPARRIVEMAHARGIPVLLDGAQAVPHLKVDVQELGCDFYAFSGHKLYGPSGIGVLYGRAEHLEAMPPYQGGGDMIQTVTFEKTTYNEIPYKFEAGTPNLAGTVGLGAAVDYVEGLGFEAIDGWERLLLERATAGLSDIPQVKIIGTAADKRGVVAFVVRGIHPHDVGTILDVDGVAVRAGHHCAQPLMDRLGVHATVRASFAFYNTLEECDALVEGVRKAVEVFR